MAEARATRNVGIPMLREGVPIGVMSLDARHAAGLHRKANGIACDFRRPAVICNREREAFR